MSLNKKWLSLLLAAALAASLTAPVYAQEPEQTEPAPITTEETAPPEAPEEDTPDQVETPDFPDEGEPEPPDSPELPDETTPDGEQPPEEENPDDTAGELPNKGEEEDEPQTGIGALRDASPLELIKYPGQVTVTLDPYEIQGLGQIYSDPLVFANDSRETVKITISGLRCETGRGVRLLNQYAYGFASEECYPEGRRPSGVSIWEALESDESKKAQVFLRNIDTGEVWILGEEEMTVEFLLEGGKTARFEIAGNMTLPSAGWSSGDIAIRMAFFGEETEKEPAEPKLPAQEGENPQQPELPEPPEPTPENPEQPDTPAEPEDPGEPTEPTEPENPENPDISETPEPPVTPEEPEEPTVPETPETPTETETPQEPEQPEESPAPDTPSEEEPVEPEPTENTDVQEPPVAPEQA